MQVIQTSDTPPRFFTKVPPSTASPESVDTDGKLKKSPQGRGLKEKGLILLKAPLTRQHQLAGSLLQSSDGLSDNEIKEIGDLPPDKSISRDIGCVSKDWMGRLDSTSGQGPLSR